MGKRLLGVAVVGLLVAVLGAGCSAKKKGAQAGAEGSGVGEEGLGGWRQPRTIQSRNAGQR